MPDRLRRFADLDVTPWRNGLGRKADIVTGEGWQLSFAWIDGPAPFSTYAGQERIIALLEGPGCRLDFAGHPPLVLDRPASPTTFSGDWPALCEPFGGPSMVLNLIAERARWRGSVEILELEEELALVPLAGPSHAVLLEGEAAIANGPALARHDTVVVAGRLVLQGKRARLALARLAPLA
ncbi:HutD family protein [Siccirubricoccus sp. KC 17139]|uniref:HutD family protein n=1 Tax=Siccirubricoccus soli TaxID=2899147 RepID=A0ABT1DA50_9PROT|nr:HutD family protein [Siccirubricoccus soli]MCO6418788.1 HutD family protein [Siccirubricoccus soli]MCP2684923.1 HutD family protein [Siccirubricoccus soli]